MVHILYISHNQRMMLQTSNESENGKYKHSKLNRKLKHSFSHLSRDTLIATIGLVATISHTCSTVSDRERKKERERERM